MKRRCLAATAYLGLIVTYSVLAAEETEPAPGSPSLQLHPVRAVEIQRVAALVTSIAEAERVLLIEPTRELAVFAKPSVQQKVARTIAEFEKTAMLQQRIDLSQAPSRQVVESVRRTLRAHEETQSKMPDAADRPQYELDPSGEALHVRGRQNHIDFVKKLVGELGRLAGTVSPLTPSPDDTRAVGDGKDSQRNAFTGSKSSAVDQESFFETDETGSRFLTVPSGPVRIVLLKELGLVMIRARRGPN